MEIENKKEKVLEALEELSWSDNNTSEIMEGFFNSPFEAIENITDRMSEDHINNLFEYLDLEEEEDKD